MGRAKAAAADPYEMRTAEKAAVGQRMVIARENAGLNQAAAARRLGYTAAVHLSQIESGHRPLPVEKLVRAAHVYGTTTDYILGLSPDPDRDRAASWQAILTSRISADMQRLTSHWSTVSVDIARKVLPDVAQGLRLASQIIEADKALAKVIALNGATWQRMRFGSGMETALRVAADRAREYIAHTERARRVVNPVAGADAFGRPLQQTLIPSVADMVAQAQAEAAEEARREAQHANQ